MGKRNYWCIAEESASNSRYGFAGAWGYEDLTADGFSLSANLMHVGARTYDPSLGRFLQRDPIGIRGGRNVYEYVFSDPVNLIDPEGAWPRGALELHSKYKGLRSSGMSPSEASGTLQKHYGNMGGGFIDSIVPFYDPCAALGMYDPNSFEAHLGDIMGDLFVLPLRAYSAWKWYKRARRFFQVLRPANPIWKAPKGIYDAFKFRNLVGGSPFLL